MNLFEQNKNFIFNTPLVSRAIFQSVRVLSIVMDESHPRFTELGGWNALGVVEYEDISNNNFNNVPNGIAYPFYSNIKHYPIPNETVFIVSLNSDNENNKKVYYVDIINLWNHPHHNIYPGVDSPLLPIEVTNNYQDVNSGLVNKIVDNPDSSTSENTLGNYLSLTFRERSNIHPLKPFDGDVIYEGRWGNSIRFGSTTTTINGVENLNPWSDNVDQTKDGDPIIIIRNGQGNRSEEGWIPIIENPDIDNSSIYLTSTQKLSTINETFSKQENRGYNVGSYKNSNTPLPTSLEQYSNSQILLNSDRVVLNTETDNIILNSFNGIHLSTPASTGNINLDSNVVTMDSNFIYLGNQSVAIEPLVLGNRLLDTLRLLLESFSRINDALSNAKTDIVIEGTYATLFELNATAKTIKPTLDEIKKLLGVSNEDSIILSKTTFTKE